MLSRLLSIVLLFAAAAAVAEDERTKRILIVGDSWAASISAENRDGFPAPDVFDRALAANGFGEFETRGAVTAWGGRKASDWVKPEHLAEMVEELETHPTIDMVHLIIGGNDLLTAAQKDGFREKTAEQRAEIWDRIVLDIENIVNACLGVRDEVRVVIAGYDYLDIKAAEAFWNMDFRGATVGELNSWMVELGEKKRALASKTPRCEYLANWGTLQRWFGDTPQSVPDPNAPMPAGIAPDGIHPNAEAHTRLLQNAIDQYYARWLREENFVADNTEASATRDERGCASVTDFGAVGDGQQDDTGAFQKALDAVAEDGGGLVTVSVGRFLIRTHLAIPDHVTLEGVSRTPQVGSKATAGTVLLAVEGQGDPEGPPFITLGAGATLSRVTIFYPEQIRANPPYAYPWTVATRKPTDDPAIIDVTMINPYQAVDFGTFPTGRHYINRLYAYPLFRGLYINQCYDVGRIENIHFWPFWDLDPASPLWTFTKENATAFLIGKTDGEMAFNCFSIFYNKGFHFIAGPIPGMEPAPGSGVYTNCYMDVTPNAVVVDQVAEHSGVSFVNCMLMSGVTVGPDNRGPVKFTACGFWDVPGLESHANLEGRGTVFFDACHFSRWDQAANGAPCIDANSRQVLITGNDFETERQDAVAVRLGPNVRAAVVSCNRLPSSPVPIIDNTRRGNVQIGLNTQAPVGGNITEWLVLGGFPNPADEGVADPKTVSRSGFDRDYLAPIGGEAEAVLRPSTTVAYTGQNGDLTVKCRRTGSAGENYIDFMEMYPGGRQVAYAFTYLHSDQPQTAHFDFGSNDSAKVWINGEQVHSVWAAQGRGARAGDDQFTAPLRKGPNRLLVKVEDAGGSRWGFVLEAFGEDGTPLGR